MNRPALKFGTRSFGVFLSLSLGLSHSAFALRSETTEGAGLEEKLAKALQVVSPQPPIASSSVRATGLEEPPAVEVIHPEVINSLNLQGIFWDHDETLWLGYPRDLATRFLAARIGVDTNDVEEMSRFYILFKEATGLHWDALMDKIRQAGWDTPPGLNEAPYLEDLNRAFWSEVRKQGLTSPQYVTPGARGLLATLRRAGVKMAIVSGGDTESRDQVLRELGLRDLFERVHGGGRKLEAVRLQQADWGLSPGQLALVGDGVNDVKLAKQAGIVAVGFARTVEDREAFLRLPSGERPDVIVNRDFRSHDALIKVLIPKLLQSGVEEVPSVQSPDEVQTVLELRWPMLAKGQGALVFDVDKTLLPNRVRLDGFLVGGTPASPEDASIAEKIRDQLVSALKLGIRVVVISGNSRSIQMERLIQPLRDRLGADVAALRSLVLYANGGATRSTFDPMGKEVLDENYNERFLLPAGLVEIIRQSLEGMLVKTRLGLVETEREAWRNWYARRKDFPGTIFGAAWLDGQPTSLSVVQQGRVSGMISAPYIEVRDGVQLSIGLLPRDPRDVRATVIEGLSRAISTLGVPLNFRKGGFASIDISRADVDKGVALAYALEHGGLNPNAVLYFGDEFEVDMVNGVRLEGNDVPILRVSGILPVAVGEKAPKLELDEDRRLVYGGKGPAAVSQWLGSLLGLTRAGGMEKPGESRQDALVPIFQEIQRGPLILEAISGRINRTAANLLNDFLAQPPSNDDAIRLFIQAFIRGELSVGDVLSGPIATYHLKPEVQETISTLALSALVNQMQTNLHDPNPWRRRRTIELLGRLTDEFEPTPELIETLRAALFDEDEEVRVITAWSLGMVASPTIGRPQGVDWPPEVFLSLLGVLVRYGSRTGTSVSMTLERYFFQHDLNIERALQPIVRMNREDILNESEISAIQQTLTGQAHDPGRLDEDPLQEMLRRTLAPHELLAVRQLLAEAFLEVAVSHRLLRRDHVSQLQALVSAEPEIRQFAEGAIKLIVQAGLEESIPLASGVTAKKVILITPEMASPQLFETLKTFKPAPGEQLPLVVFGEHDFHVEEIQRWLDQAGLKALEVVNVKQQLEGHKGWNLFDVVAAKQAEYYLGTGADIHTIWFFEDLKNLGRFLGVAPIHIQPWEKSLERQYGTQA